MLVSAGLPELTYELATRALEEQEGALRDLRSRAGTLLAAAALVATFLGSAALSDGAFELAEVVAILALFVTLGMCLWTLLPHRPSRSTHAPRTTTSRRTPTMWIGSIFASRSRFVISGPATSHGSTSSIAYSLAESSRCRSRSWPGPSPCCRGIVAMGQTPNPAPPTPPKPPPASPSIFVPEKRGSSSPVDK